MRDREAKGHPMVKPKEQPQKLREEICRQEERRKGAVWGELSGGLTLGCFRNSSESHFDFDFSLTPVQEGLLSWSVRSVIWAVEEGKKSASPVNQYIVYEFN